MFSLTFNDQLFTIAYVCNGYSNSATGRWADCLVTDYSRLVVNESYQITVDDTMIRVCSGRNRDTVYENADIDGFKTCLSEIRDRQLRGRLANYCHFG
jgi:hypothetical protein